jgi:hypothetical protein
MPLQRLIERTCQTIFVLLKQIALLHQNFTSNQLSVKIMQPLVAVENILVTTRGNNEGKTCKHKDEKGWCSKSNRQCRLVTDLF